MPPPPETMPGEEDSQTGENGTGSVNGTTSSGWDSKAGSQTEIMSSPPSSGKTGCWAKCNYCCIRNCKPCLTEFHDVDEHSSCWERFQYAFMCPPHGKVASWIAKVFGAIMIWGTFWAILGDPALPGGNFFGILFMSYVSELGGNLVKLTPLPPLLGMLMAGFGVRNIPVIQDWCPIENAWAGNLRSVALVIILLRAGSGLDPKALRKTKWVALRLALFPCLVEAAVCAVAAHYFLGFPWTWAFVMGFVYAAVSPAVVVQGMVALQDKGWGRAEGIPTLLVAACGINDVIAISGFSIVLGIALSSGSVILNAFHGPIEFALGIFIGVVIGIFFWYIPNKNSKQLLLYRFVLLFTAGMFATFGTRRIKFAGAGTLGTLIMAFVAGIGWRKRTWSPQNYPVKATLAKFWKVMQPILFGLIGYAVSIENLKKGQVGLGVGMLFLGLAARLVVTYFSAFGQNFNWKEKLFMVIAWIPKATVQAAIGSVALDQAMALGKGQDVLDIAQEILTNAAVCIIITAPIGAAGIALSAPFLLKPAPPEGAVPNDVESARKHREGVDNKAYEMPHPTGKVPVVGIEYNTKL